MLRYIFALMLFTVMGTASAAIDTYEFSDDVTRERFQSLATELRCPKCQNQNIADSNSPIAKDLRDELHRMLENGANDDQIVDFMVTRYGEFVLYRPRVSSQTYLLWYAPAVLLVIGVIVIVLVSGKRKRKQIDGDAPDTLSEQERERLNQLLKQDKEQ